MDVVCSTVPGNSSRKRDTEAGNQKCRKNVKYRTHQAVEIPYRRYILESGKYLERYLDTQQVLQVFATNHSLYSNG